MRTDGDERPGDDSLRSLGYEARDVPTRLAIVSAFWFFVFAVGSGVLGWVFLTFWHVVPEVKTEQQPFHSAHPPPGFPILQNNSNNTSDIAELRAHEAEVLTTSGPGDAPGYYHIPIDAAIKLIARRGIPATGTTSAAAPKPPTPVATAKATPRQPASKANP